MFSLKGRAEKCTPVCLLGLTLALGCVAPVLAETAHRGSVSTPSVTGLTIQPSSLSLENGRDLRSVIVTGHTTSGYSVDLTSQVKFTCASPIIRVDSDGYIEPLKPGKTSLIVTLGNRTAQIPVEVKSIAAPPVSFVRDVMPVLSKSGCNAGTCHGSAKGKNGFKLSLRGYDPEYDHHALIDDVSGRRFNRSDPEQSLMLLKPTGAVPHRGGVVFLPGSRDYVMLKRWISEGAKSDTDRVKRASSLEVLPKVPSVTLPGMTQKTIVIAHYPDGSARDVTRAAVLTSSLPEVATVSAAGEITAVRRGEAAVLVRYEGTYATNTITVLGKRDGYRWVDAPEFNFIDRLVDAKLKKIKALPAPLCDDASFLRRVSIDLTGLPPSPQETRNFLQDTSPAKEKRVKLVDKFLKSPEYIDRWSNKWADLLDCNSKYLGVQGVRKFRDWIHAAITDNMPYDQFVRQLVTATGDSNQNAPSNYLRVIREPSTATENVTQLFLGVRFSCNKCHDHPFERWTQNQYYQFGAFFAQVGYKPGGPGTEVVFNKDSGEVMHPKTGLAVAPEVPVGHGPRTAELADRRKALGDWLTSKDNPYFSHAIVNRIWSYFLGRGIVDPVDDIRAGNPPVNPELYEALNKDFVDNGFDLKHLMRTIVLSRVYQSSISASVWNADDKINFSHAIPRRLEAEQLLDAINQATGTQSVFNGLPAGTKAGQLPDAAANGADGFLDLFGRPARETPCECERSSTVSLGQAMALINGPTTGSLSNGQGRVTQLMATNPSDPKLVEEIFLSVLCRMPTAREMQAGTDTLKSAKSRTEGAQDLMWALLNSPSFLFNR